MTGPENLIAPYLLRWSLVREGEPIETHSSLILSVRAGREPALLKLFKPASDEMRSSSILAHYNGRGAVRVLRSDAGGVLLERAQPGEALSDLVRAGHDEEATRLFCDVAAKLHGAPPPPPGVRSLEDWGQAFVRYRQGAPHPLLDAALLDEAEAMFFALCRSQTRRVLLHGDLHHDNILFDAARGWLAIDPKGVVGEPEYECGALLRNPAGSEEVYLRPDVMARRTAILSRWLGHDPKRLLSWSFAQGLLSALWAIEDGWAGTLVARAVAAATSSHSLLASYS